MPDPDPGPVGGGPGIALEPPPEPGVAERARGDEEAPGRIAGTSGSVGGDIDKGEPTSGQCPSRQNQTSPYRPPTASVPSGPNASDESRSSKPLSWILAAESCTVQTEVEPDRPVAASDRPSGENARSAGCSDVRTMETRLWATGSQSSMGPEPARASSVPRGLKRIIQTML